MGAVKQVRKAWEAVQPELTTNAEGVACYKGVPFKLASGLCVATATNGIIS